MPLAIGISSTTYTPFPTRLAIGISSSYNPLADLGLNINFFGPFFCHIPHYSPTLPNFSKTQKYSHHYNTPTPPPPHLLSLSLSRLLTPPSHSLSPSLPHTLSLSLSLPYHLAHTSTPHYHQLTVSLLPHFCFAFAPSFF